MRKFLKEQSAVTLIALMVTIIILSILAGVTISVMFKEDGILDTAKQTTFESERNKFLEDAQTAYTRVYSKKEDRESRSEVTLKDVTDILIQDYGYTDRVFVEENGSKVSVRDTNIIVDENESRQLGIDLVIDANAFVKLKDKYYPIILENGKIKLGSSTDKLDFSTKEFEISAESADTSVATVSSINKSNIVIKGMKEGTTNITITYGSSSATIRVSVSNIPVLANVHAYTTMVNSSNEVFNLKYDWDVFYEDKSYIYLLYGDYLENEAIPESNDVVIDGSNVYAKCDDNAGSDKKTDARKKFQKYLSDTNIWKPFSESIARVITEKGAKLSANDVTTVGAMKLDFFEKAYNDDDYRYNTCGKLHLYTCPKNSKEGSSNFLGYYYREEDDYDSKILTFDDSLRMGSHAKNDYILFPHGTYEEKVDTGGTNSTKGYWLNANFYYDFSETDTYLKGLDDQFIQDEIKDSKNKKTKEDIIKDYKKTYKMIEMNYNGYMIRVSCDEKEYGLRPLVTIPNTTEIRSVLGLD